MMTLGFMSLSHQHEKAYAEELAKKASDYGIGFIRFTPLDISPGSMLVKALTYHPKSGQWNEVEREIPELIYDRCFYGRNQQSKKAKPIVEWLKKYPKTEFLGLGLPEKWTVYNALKADPVLQAYLPPTSLAASAQTVLRRLAKEKSCILKPAYGSGGRGIIHLELSGKTVKAAYQVGKHKQIKSFSKQASFETWCKKVLQHRYLLQTFLDIQDKDGYPCDIRLLLQKNGSGEWETVGKTVRRSYQHGLLTNLAEDSESVSFDSWLSNVPKKRQAVLLDDLDTIANAVPHALESGHGPLFELGLDICLTKDGKVWLLDVNSKPGKKAFLQYAPENRELLYKGPFEYCSFLAESRDKKGVGRK
ncbi:endospore coat-associated protein [Bacillus glycinifermentans]|uniref:Endospore coat-associated protein n=1 Tax=Bacillus glycinifermentans TaxID=1664069 RepID=A0A0J6EJ85_9BACI|nr:YheC/YheD family protein [Bacillus glycinifermentans]ATH94917.1 endospore coat-associated protein [Bacillus glycinifermentans]KMM63550.1 endospore coat-associated protein [Bacillus glycinifermentans]KRT94497.1 endospore coat-associated protein [Bacillus glycinifermentans]MEC0486737.1 YheC/YheD family protein [Bacillus glycinifermentans]MEC0493847.1 YheC/YheD family protein [Bacillus glycinifermentans]